MSTSIGNIGRYSVTEELGRGSMGVVHLAHDPVMSRDLAIKTILLPHGLLPDEKDEFHQRFLREAQAAGRLSHPGIVTVYDFNGEHDDDPPFIAMEYVEGPTLHELLCREGALATDHALTMAETLADALQLAHESDVVHRDLKPANILVRRSDGVPKIADFGVARINSAELSLSGTAYGSPAYMAPERIEGQPSDHRSDLFSLAVILYEALCGERPFTGDSFHSICHAITHHDPVPIRNHAPELSPAFERLFARALHKNPAERFTDGASMRDALYAIRAEQANLGAGVSTVMIRPAVAEPTATVGPVVPGTPSDTNQDDRLLSWGDIPERWIVIGPIALGLMLLCFAAGWGLRSSRPVDARTPGTPSGTEQIVPSERPPVSTVEIEAEPLVSLAEPSAPVGKPAMRAARPIPAKPDAPRSSAPSEPVAPPPVPAPESGTATPRAATRPLSAVPTKIEPPRAAVAPKPIVESAYLEMQLTSKVTAGTLTLLVDGEQVYFTELASPESKKFSRAYKKMLGKAKQVLDERIEIPAGHHTVEALLITEVRSREYREATEIEVEPGQEQGLSIVAGRTLGRRLSIELD